MTFSPSFVPTRYAVRGARGASNPPFEQLIKRRSPLVQVGEAATCGAEFKATPVDWQWPHFVCLINDMISRLL